MHIRVNDLCFSYGKSVKALEKISFEIAEGERLALTGHNGSGKSTLVKHLNGLLKPSDGEVWVDGKNTTAMRTAELAHYVGLLFQNPDDQICKRTVRDEVEFGPKNLRYPEEKRIALVEDALELFDLRRFEQSNPHDFGYSGRKRIAMASIVAMDTPILVFDEPTSGLDCYEISLFISALDTLLSQGKTIVTISHDMDFVAENFSRVISLDNGRKVFDGSVRTLFQENLLMERCGLHPPQVMRLCEALNMRTVVLNPAELIEKL